MLLLDLNICDGLHFLIIVANYAGHNSVRKAMAIRANQSSTEWFTARAKITCSQLEPLVAPSDGQVFIILNDSCEFSGI